MTLTDADRNIVAASRGIADLLGFDRPEDLRGQPAASFVLDGAHVGDHEQDGVATIRALHGGTFRFAFHVRTVRFGKDRYALADGHVIPEPPPPLPRKGPPPYVSPDAWLTREEAAERAHVSVKTIDRAIKRGDLQASRIGRRVLMRRRWLDVWLGMLIGFVFG